MKKIQNPLIPNGPTKFIKSITTSSIVKDYDEQLSVDVGYIFDGLKKIDLYECLTTGYQFFYPYSVAGDGIFYEKMSTFKWYYMPWKWEHEIILDNLHSSDKVLEIGCGQGGFLKKITPEVIKAVGLELNQEAVSTAKKNGLKVYSHMIEDYAKKNQGKYSMVVTFQVLEHISNVHSFLKASIECLQPGGRLVISVPNNIPNSPIIGDSILNQPPHHMGRWDTNSLLKLASIFPLRVEKIYNEPLQQYHRGFFSRHAMKVIRDQHPIFMKLTQTLTQNFTNYLTGIYSPYLTGHSILIVFSKLDIVAK